VSGWPMVKFGEVLTPNRRPYLLGDDEDANLVGMRLYALGPFHRELKPAGQIRKKSHFVIRQGDVIYNKLFAWKGTFGIVPPELDGMFVSDKFPTYALDDTRVDPSYLRWYFRYPEIWEQARRLSTGSAALSKLTLNPPRFLDLTMPIPPIEEQRRVVEKLNRLSKSAHSVLACSRHNGGMVEHLWSATLASAFPETADTTLGDFAAVQSGYAFKSEWFEADGIRLVRNVNIGHGTVTWGQQACIAQGRRHEFGRFELELGDILVSLDRPIISTGVKVARIRQVDLPSLLLQRVGRIQMRAPELDPDYLYLWLRSPRFVNAIDPGRSNGVPHISPKDIERLPFAAPTLAKQRGIVARLHRLEGIVRRAVSARSVVVTEAEAILTSALRDAFENSAPDRSACA
jgi:Type I restriction modification DNA specificity domain